MLLRYVVCIATSILAAWAHASSELPWHLGAHNPNNTAPSAINTVNVKPGSQRIVVAVIDSGVIATHPSLNGQLLPGYDMLSAPNNLRGGRSTNFSPDERDARCGQRLVSSAFRTHGTEVASLIAANGNEGVYGVNPSAKILPIRLFGACSMSRSDLLDAIAWAAGFPVWLSHNPNKQPSDLSKEFHKFFRKVTPLEKCNECNPKGLAANSAISQP